MKKILYICSIMLILLFAILAFIIFFDTKEGYAPTKASIYSNIKTLPAPYVAPPPIAVYNANNYDIQYHASADDIQAQMGTDLSSNLITVLDKSGNLIQVPFASAPTSVTYYTSGTMKYNPTNYVPNYEDTIYFSKLTGLGYQSPAQNDATQWGGFCRYNRFFPEKIEESCNKLDANVCASTSCCLWLGNQKCVAGGQRGPYFQAHYSDLDNKNMDRYFYMGRCYGNCIDDQPSNYYDYEITKNAYAKTFPGFSYTNPAYLPSTSDYINQIAPNGIGSFMYQPYGSSGTSQTFGWKECHIDSYGNLVDNKNTIVASNIRMDSQGNYIDSSGNIVKCPSFGGAPAPAPAPISSPIMSAAVSLPTIGAPVSTPIMAAPVSLPTIGATPIMATPTVVPATSATTFTPVSTPAFIHT